ncbi:hypothetical protein PPL_09004 [Heterostelium album PN500]|uniref:Uncharacterized protein n=1 Tax=Heterostelium pallidum (strain ATCC 26659 / Pp 5 / PN500) TaxID=670386 RepID=D3BKC3_HETP5|nr:hypothetical protein PPL_09004 [Heterostelium album PN500]EFA78353.1 hypothetical protein PPL_09004 [Heterostelium album PN500]|eukprot:XP_020430478.1 hypothetical protein PPL_09004 [Heterostelium album PN500]
MYIKSIFLTLYILHMMTAYAALPSCISGTTSSNPTYAKDVYFSVT